MATPVANSVELTQDPLRDGLLQGSSWTFAGSHQLTYSFNLNFDYNPQGQPVPGPGGTWDNHAALAAAALRALTAWSDVANLSFVLLPSDSFVFESTADITFGLTGSDLQDSFSAVALGFFPDPAYVDQFLQGAYTRAQYPRPEGDVLIDNSYAGFGNTQPGGYAQFAILHELGHALGLKHPFDDGGNARPTFLDLGIGAYDSQRHTVMSYAGIENLGLGHAVTPMPFDILAIQQIYGANLSYHDGDDFYAPVIDSKMRTLWDAGGIDTLDLGALSTGVMIDLRPGAVMDLPADTVLAIAYGSIIENGVGGAGDDTLIGNSAANQLQGGDGNDTLDGGDGPDSLLGGSGFDSLLGGPGNDTLRGADNADTLIGGDGDDSLAGGKGVDFVDGGEGNDTLSGGVGNDILIGGNGNDRVDYSLAIDGVTVNLTIVGVAQFVSTGQSSDTLSGLENITGSNLDDRLTGDASANSLLGLLGNDTLIGNEGFDTLEGGEGNDLLAGGNNADLLIGGPGNDTLGGGKGMDTLDGGDGNDLLNGTLGADLLTGGNGADVFLFNSLLDGVANIDTITDFTSGVDMIRLSAAIFGAFAGQVGQTVGTGPNLLYNSGSGVLAYDADGAGGAIPVTFAILGVSVHPATVGLDFLIVG